MLKPSRLSGFSWRDISAYPNGADPTRLRLVSGGQVSLGQIVAQCRLCAV